MTEVFLKILSMSFSASWLILAVLGLRLLLRKMPKRGNVQLWGLVALRLLLPFSMESRYSLIPGRWITGESPTLHPIDPPIYEGQTISANHDIRLTTVFSILWLAGVMILLVYFVIRYWLLLRKVNTAVLLRDNIFQSEFVAAPIVVGIVNPKIYLPFEVEQPCVDYIIAHEQAHIRRRDHWWKLLGFALLALHWFNPLVWIAYVLLCRDIEMACDEAVIRDLDNNGRADYAQTLVTYSTKHQSLAVHPLSFGKTGVRERLKAIMDYRKPSHLNTALMVISCTLMAIFFLTDPAQAAQTELPPKDEAIETTLPTTSATNPAFSEPAKNSHPEVDMERLKQEKTELSERIDALQKAYLEERERQNMPTER